MNRRRVLSLLGYTGLSIGAFTLGVAWQRPQLFSSLIGESPSTPAARSPDSDFVMPATLAEFSFPDVVGQTHALSDWSDKSILLNFWATWCGPCREEVPLLIDMQNRYADTLQVVGLALDRVEPTRRFTDEYGINYPSLVPGQDEGFALLEQYQPSAMLPFSLLVDRQRRIVSSKLGAYHGEELVKELDALVN